MCAQLARDPAAEADGAGRVRARGRAGAAERAAAHLGEGGVRRLRGGQLGLGPGPQGADRGLRREAAAAGGVVVEAQLALSPVGSVVCCVDAWVEVGCVVEEGQ